MKNMSDAYRPLLLILLFSFFSASSAFAADANEIDWESLIPQDWNPNQVFEDMTDEQYYALSDSELLVLEQTVQAMFDAAPVVDAFEGKRVKIPGFVLPLEFSSTLLKEFLLETGTKLESIYLPVWITGTLNISRLQSELTESGVANGLAVQSGYSIDVESIEPYIEQW